MLSRLTWLSKPSPGNCRGTVLLSRLVKSDFISNGSANTVRGFRDLIELFALSRLDADLSMEGAHVIDKAAGDRGRQF
jgi:hypothetical protein